MKKTKTNTTVTADKQFGDCNFDISENSKRLVRATLKTYGQIGTYVFLKVFKKATEDAEFEFVQRLYLTNEEFLSLLKSKNQSERKQVKFLILLKTKTNHSLIVNVPGNLNFPQTQTNSSTTRINFSSQNGRSYVRSCFTWFLCKKFQPNFKFVFTEKVLNLSTFKVMLLEATQIWVLPFFSWNWKKISLTRIHSVDSEEQLNQFFSSQTRFSVPSVFTCFKYFYCDWFYFYLILCEN